ncbi:hypothetical protein ACROYT_G012433, partial [Oculina patagonica]
MFTELKTNNFCVKYINGNGILNKDCATGCADLSQQLVAVREGLKMRYWSCFDPIQGYKGVVLLHNVGVFLCNQYNTGNGLLETGISFQNSKLHFCSLIYCINYSVVHVDIKFNFFYMLNKYIFTTKFKIPIHLINWQAK